jgi:AraC-like DNA-binding protein
MRAALNGCPPAGRAEPCRILLVEPDLGVLASLAVALGAGVELDQAVRVPEVLECLVGRPPHVVILNAGLPGLDAGAITRAARAQRAGVRVVVVADRAQADRVIELARAPLDGLLWQPVPVARLARQVAELVAQEWSWPSLAIRPLPSQRVSRCLDQVCRRFADTLSARTISAAVGASVSHLGHRFRAETGLTIRAYLMRVRIAAACHLLRTTELKLEAIAERTGFCDASHLSRAFREQTGLRPGEYRRHRRAPARPGRTACFPEGFLAVD